MLISLSSTSGAPGVSSWALALTVAWPSPHPRVLLEADMSGGVLAGWFGMTIDPGVASLVSQARLEPDRLVDVAGHGRRLTDSAWCVPGPISAKAARPIWQGGASIVAPRLSADDRLWFADCGRVQPADPNRPLLDQSMAHLVFSDSSDASLMLVSNQIVWLSELARVGLVVVGDRRRSTAELVDFVGCDAVWKVARRENLSGLVAAATRSAWVRRSPAWRSIVRSAADVADWWATPPDPLVGLSVDGAAVR